MCNLKNLLALRYDGNYQPEVVEVEFLVNQGKLKVKEDGTWMASKCPGSEIKGAKIGQARDLKQPHENCVIGVYDRNSTTDMNSLIKDSIKALAFVPSY